MTNHHRNRTVLVADDEPEIVDLVRLLLEWEGYSVFEATDGEEALAQARDLVPDLIFMDVRMPKLSGLEVLEQIQSDPILAVVPVVMLSVITTYPQVRKALENGAVAYLPKPFELQEMARLVKGILSKDAAGREEIRLQALGSLEAQR